MKQFIKKKHLERKETIQQFLNQVHQSRPHLSQSCVRECVKQLLLPLLPQGKAKLQLLQSQGLTLFHSNRCIDLTTGSLIWTREPEQSLSPFTSCRRGSRLSTHPPPTHTKNPPADQYLQPGTNFNISKSPAVQLFGGYNYITCLWAGSTGTLSIPLHQKGILEEYLMNNVSVQCCNNKN